MCSTFMGPSEGVYPVLWGPGLFVAKAEEDHMATLMRAGADPAEGHWAGGANRGSESCRY